MPGPCHARARAAPVLVAVLAAVFVAVLGVAAGADRAVAGAWPRARGETFVSVAQGMSTGATTLLAATVDLRSWSSVYAEHGLTERLTLGLDAGLGQGRDARVETALVFARLPVWSPGAHRVAVDLGLGTLVATDEERQTRLRAGLAWGRGIAAGRHGGGWLGMEGALELREPAGAVAAKADFTAGWKPNDRWMAIAQVQTGAYPDVGGIVRLAPSLVRRVSARSHLQLGVTAEIVGERALGLSGAVWFDF